MTPDLRRAPLALLMLAAAVLLFAAGLLLLIGGGVFGWLSLLWLPVQVAFPAIGYFIVAHAKNRIGWIFLLAGLGVSIQALCWGYSQLAFEGGIGPLPGAIVAAWISEIVWLPQLALATMFLFLLFPDGRLPSRRWRWVVRAGVAGVILTEVAIAFAPTLYSYPERRAPLAGLIPPPMIDLLANLGTLLALPAMLLALFSIVVRYLQANGVGRQQIKWFAVAAALFFASQMTFNVFEVARGNALADIASGISTLLIPLSVAVAIFRYRLYDIDVVINRTLVYLVLTAILVAVYLGTVVLLQEVVTGVTTDSDIAVAASTLAVAALFRPVRSRVQAFIDQRFYRRKYDAAATLERFSSQLRDQVDLDSVNAQVLGVVRETVQPSHASLWLRPGSGS